MSDGIIYETRGEVGILRVDRPHARNALSWAAQDAFAAQVDRLRRQPDIAALIVTGTGDRAFVAGGDIKEHIGRFDPAAGARLNRTMSTALAQLAQLPYPVIAAINGDAYGGGWEIVTACDLRLMRAGTQLHFVQVKVGLTSGWGGAGRLVRLIGLSRALDLLLTGRALSAEAALDAGLIHRVVPASDDVLAAAVAWARQLGNLPRDAVAALKRLAYAAASGDSAAMAALEAALFQTQWGSPNHREALAAFSERRAPRFNSTTVDDPS